MGDTPINLNSPEQLSWIIYSRRVIDKTDWANTIDPYMETARFNTTINTGTEKLMKTVAQQCPDCKGTGYIHKTKKDGTPYAKPSRCKTCDTLGFLLNNTSETAGLRFKPPSPKWFSANGFTTSKQNLQILEGAARAKGMTDAVDFLSKVRCQLSTHTYLLCRGIATTAGWCYVYVCFNIVQPGRQAQTLTCRTCHVAARFLLKKYSCHDLMAARFLRQTLPS